MLTARLTGLRQVIAHTNGDAIAAARSGKRFCPLTLPTIRTIPKAGSANWPGRQTITVVAAMAREHRQNQGESIVMDPELEAWLVGPAADGDLAALERPASRLQLAALPEVARLLRETRVFANGTRQ